MNRSRPLRASLLVAAAMALSACMTLAGGERVAPSSYGCMRAVRDRIPTGIADKRAHCLAAGTIALHCSVSEAYIAGYGKEFSDLFTGGDAEWADIRADKAGIRCARAGRSDAALAACCETVATRPQPQAAPD